MTAAQVPPESAGRLSGPAFVVSVVATLLLLRALDIGIQLLARLPAAGYERRFFLDGIATRAWFLATERIPWWITALLGALVTGGALLDARRLNGAGRRHVMRVFGGWSDLQDGRDLRRLVMAITGIAAWALSCYPRNLYFDQTHPFERLLVVGLWLAIAWRPVFVLPFALVATAVAGQFTIPLGFISWTEMRVVMLVPVLFGAFWFVRAATGSRRSDVFIFALCCLLAATYWTSGLGKLRVNWLSHPHVHLLLPDAYANGWLAHVGTEAIVRMTAALEPGTRLLMAGTLAIECGALVLLWRRWSLAGFFLLAIAFHVATFALTGILFWKWIAVELLLLVYLLGGNGLVRLKLFTRPRFALSVGLIAVSPLWLRAEDLTWFDTPLTYSMRFAGIAADGATYTLPAGFFRPYSDAVVLGTFPEVSPHAQLTHAMGVTKDRALAGALVAARSPADVYELEASHGGVRVDIAGTEAFDDFVTRHAQRARCRTERDPLLLRIAAAPRHLWTFPLYESLPCDARLVAVHVYELTTLFTGDSLQVIRRQLVREITAAEPQQR